jgi:hypothetical protein
LQNNIIAQQLENAATVAPADPPHLLWKKSTMPTTHSTSP